jgi:hypothetical protein
MLARATAEISFADPSEIHGAGGNPIITIFGCVYVNHVQGSR